jgi:hypothetical protein
MLGRCSTTELHPQPGVNILTKYTQFELCDSSGFICKISSFLERKTCSSTKADLARRT